MDILEISVELGFVEAVGLDAVYVLIQRIVLLVILDYIRSLILLEL